MSRDYTVERDWITEAGFRAVVILGSMGFRCGYVGIPTSHPLHGIEYGAQTDKLASVEEEQIGKRGIVPALLAAATGNFQSPDVVFDVHGGLTYSGSGAEYPVASDGLWWFGYDCGHLGDGRTDEYCEQQRQLYPDMSFMWCDSDGVERSLDYCVSECESLAKQLVYRVIFQNDEAQA